MGDSVSAFFKGIAHPFKWLSSKANRKRLQGCRAEVIACILTRNPEPSILLGRSPHKNMWMPPQEGVNIKESFDNALIRCLSTECGLTESNEKNVSSKLFHFRSTTYIGDLKLSEERQGERPVADDVLNTWLESVTLKGKAYWASIIFINSQDSIKPKADGKELLELKWFSIKSARSAINETNDPKKASLLMTVLDKCERDIGKA